MSRPAEPRNSAEAPGRQVTGRMVLFILLGFFGAVILANAIMLRFAIATFSGVSEKNAYTAGLSHDRAVADARRQDALGWRVEARLSRVAPGRSRVELTRAGGASPGLLAATARFQHPADTRNDVTLDLGADPTGRWSGVAPLSAGAWDLVIELRAGDEVVFRSRERVRVEDGGV
ncbi:MAG TPA: FixH family protein [Beijerinckiaceae bacterium]